MPRHRPVKHTGQFTIRPMMVPADMEQVCRLAERFFYESSFRGLTINLDAYRKTIMDYYRYPSVKSLVAVTDQGDIVGYIHIYCQQDYTVELIGEMYQFYVAPEYRGTKVSRSLIEGAVAQYKMWGCAVAYCECAPGMEDEKHLQTFSNLWVKYGYKPVGRAFMLDLGGHNG